MVGLAVVMGNSLLARPRSAAISATALPNYVRATDALGKPLPESYVFTEGKFFGGQTFDRSLGRVKFDDIVKTLAPHLATQNYFPTKDVPSANLIICVHWGATTTYEDPMKDFAIDDLNTAISDYNAGVEATGIGDAGALNGIMSDRAFAMAGAQGAVERNATLLGYQQALRREMNKPFLSSAEQTMNAELNEERYFVILMAYDYQHLKKEKKSRLLWVTRISVRSPGTNFLEAMPAIAQAGAEVYGHQVDDLIRIRNLGRKGRVELGDLKSLGSTEEKIPSEPQKK